MDLLRKITRGQKRLAEFPGAAITTRSNLQLERSGVGMEVFMRVRTNLRSGAATQVCYTITTKEQA